MIFFPLRRRCCMPNFFHRGRGEEEMGGEREEERSSSQSFISAVRDGRGRGFDSVDARSFVRANPSRSPLVRVCVHTLSHPARMGSVSFHTKPKKNKIATERRDASCDVSHETHSCSEATDGWVGNEHTMTTITPTDRRPYTLHISSSLSLHDQSFTKKKTQKHKNKPSSKPMPQHTTKKPTKS